MLSERDLERISFIAQNGAEGQEVCALEICVASVPEMVAEIRRLQHEAVKSAEVGAALEAVIADLEMRADLKRGDAKGIVDIGCSVYEHAKAVLDRGVVLTSELERVRAELAHAREVAGHYKRLIHDVVASLPHSRDWLDPYTESAMRAIVKGE